MRYVEVFRHSKRGEGKGLSEEGRELARRACPLLARQYDLVFSSPKERDIIPLAACWLISEALNYLRLQGETYLRAVTRIARRLPEEGRPLVVSHGGILEAAVLLGCHATNCTN
jgi:broad specificity phosphatase PhoE